MFGLRLDKKIIRYAKTDLRTIALPEAEWSGQIIKAAEYCTKKKIANIVLIGDEKKIKNTFLNSNFDNITFINPKTYDKKEELTRNFYELRKAKGLTLKEAQKLILDPIYFATMLLETGEVDGVVGGAATTTANMLRPALQIIKTKENIKTVSSSFIMLGKRRFKIGDKGVFVVGDCAVNQNPNKNQLADIAIATANTAKTLAQLEPRVAMLSYSTHGSNKSEDVKKVANATKLVKERDSELLIEGELQADSALMPKVARIKVNNNNWKGNANVLIFPDLNSGNISYKLLRVAGKVKAIGPIIQGLKKPVNDLSRGASLKEIVLTIAITSLQATDLSEEERIKRKKEEKLLKKELKRKEREEKKALKRQEKEEKKLAEKEGFEKELEQLEEEKESSNTKNKKQVKETKKEESKKEETDKKETNKEQKEENKNESTSN